MNCKAHMRLTCSKTAERLRILWISSSTLGMRDPQRGFGETIARGDYVTFVKGINLLTLVVRGIDDNLLFARQ